MKVSRSVVAVCLLVVALSQTADAASVASSVMTAAHLSGGGIVDGISDAISRTSKKLGTAATDNLLTGTDGFAKIYKDTVGRPVTTAGVAVQNVATSLTNSNKIFGDGFRASIDDTVSRPMASIAGTAQNLIASGGASSGAWFDNAITKPFSLFGSAARDLLSGAFPTDVEATTVSSTAVAGGGESAASASAAANPQLFSASGQPMSGLPAGSLGLSGYGQY